MDEQTQTAIERGALSLLNSTPCRDCGSVVPLDVAQEYQLCSVCDSIEKTDAVMGEGR